MNTRDVLCGALAVSLVVSCGSQSSIPRGPGQAAKGDVAAELKQQMAWEDWIIGWFNNDLESHAYQFEVRSDAEITLSVKRHASSVGIEVWLLEPPAIDDGDEPHSALPSGPRIAALDGAGKIAHQRLRKAGVYTIVVRAATPVIGSDGEHIWNRYSLHLHCEGGQCLPDDAPATLDPLPIDDAVSATVFPLDTEYTYTHLAARYRVKVVPGSNDAPTLAAVAKTTGGIFKQEIYEEYEAFDEFLYNASSRAALEATLEDDWLEDDDREPMSLEAFEAAAGFTGYVVGGHGYAYGCAPSVTCSGTLWTLYNPNTLEVYVIDYGGGDE